MKQFEAIKSRPEAGAVDRAWMNKNKALLMMQVKNTCASDRAETHVEKMAHAGAWWGYRLTNQRHWMAAVRPLGIVTLIILVPMSGWVSTVNASLLSVPGDTLYGVKIMSEKVQLSLTSNKKTEIALRTEFAVRRADEVVKLQAKPIADEQTKGHIQKTIKRLEEEIKTVSTELDKLAQQKDVQDVIEVARNVDTKSGEIVATLGTGDFKTDIPEITDVKALIDHASVKAVETAVHKLSETGGADEQIKSTIETKLKDAAVEIEKVLFTLQDDKPSSTDRAIDQKQKTSIEEKLKLAAEAVGKALATLDYDKPSTTPKVNESSNAENDALAGTKEVIENISQAVKAEDFEKAVATIKEVQLTLSEAKKTVLTWSEVHSTEGLSETASVAPSNTSSTPEKPKTEKPSEGSIEADMMMDESGAEELPEEAWDVTQSQDDVQKEEAETGTEEVTL